MFQFNLCGVKVDGSCPSQGNYGSGTAIPAIVSSAVDFKPDVMTLNELCYPQYLELKKYLTEKGYPMFGRFVTAHGSVSGCDKGSSEVPPEDSENDTDGNPRNNYGNALFSARPLGNVDRHRLTADDQTPGEVRRMVCADTSVPVAGAASRVFKACAAHLIDKDHTKGQAARLAGIVNGYIDSGYPVVVGGDFNLVPESDGLDPLYNHHGGTGRFNEADETDYWHYLVTMCGLVFPDDNCRSGEPSTGPGWLGRKIDYLFVSGAHFTDVDADVTDTSVSDHKPYRGWATLTGGYPGGMPDPDPDPHPGYPHLPVDLPPSVSAGIDVSGAEGGTVRLTGSATDAEGTPAVSWTWRPVNGVDPGTTCAFGSPAALTTTFSCDDDGEFAVTLTADDGKNPPVSDTARVRIANVPPKLDLRGPAPWQVFRAGAEVALDAPFTDPGNDTHTCTVTWDDGSTDTYPAASGKCDKGHVFAKPGMYTMEVTVTDDDGASDKAKVMIVVYDPDAGFVTGAGAVDSPLGQGRFNLNPKYLPHDEGPPPAGGKLSFRVKGAGFQLASTAFDWLVVAPGGKTAVRGTGTVNGKPGFGFVGYATDEPDAFRLVVWDLAASPHPGEDPLFDSVRGKDYDLDLAAPAASDKGSIRVH
ncbi:PKD domain-containing protein [Nonomuraea sp. NBC_01738]|uniref:endonuclease/exonuclease/phosphatase family protein n=1 Tax=Nonomuraea sp. NBC_01738 TaxID=2976003 RepID=UPI002E1534EF|nr:PKD domain-containing protein [Nonomuraea sp. NBC_01738]